MVHMFTIGDDSCQCASASAKIVTLVLVHSLFAFSMSSITFMVTLANILSPMSSWDDKGNHHQGETWLA